jgi:hypothetical protein
MKECGVAVAAEQQQQFVEDTSKFNTKFMTLGDAVYIAIIALSNEKKRPGGYDSKACRDAESILMKLSEFLSSVRL